MLDWDSKIAWSKGETEKRRWRGGAGREGKGVGRRRNAKKKGK